jgi:hypothetical protein
LEKNDDGLPELLGARFKRFNRWVHVQTSFGGRHIIVLALGCSATIVRGRERAVKTYIVKRTVGIRNLRETASFFQASHDGSNRWLAVRQRNHWFKQVRSTDKVSWWFGSPDMSRLQTLSRGITIASRC